MGRYKITEPDLLERVLRFLVSQIGSEISINKIVTYFKSEKITISHQTVEKYVDGFLNGLILYRAPRYDIKGKQLLQRLEKYYVVDLGFRELLTPHLIHDDGRMLENIIFLELKRRHAEVYVGKIRGYEVDFVALDYGAKPTYYQVALETTHPETLGRELRSLKAIRDSHPKLLLTLDTLTSDANYEGIQKRNALQWLLED